MPKRLNGSKGGIRTGALSITNPAFYHWATALKRLRNESRLIILLMCCVRIYVRASKLVGMMFLIEWFFSSNVI